MKLRHILESGERTVKKAYGNEYISNPTIMDVERGNMIRLHGRPAHKNYSKEHHSGDWGQMVLDVDYKKGLILVAEYQGGTKEFKEWAHIDDVKVTWNIGGYERAMELMGQLGGAVEDTLKKQEKVLGDADRDKEIEKHVKFKR